MTSSSRAEKVHPSSMPYRPHNRKLRHPILFIAQHHQRVDSRGAQCRNVAGQQGNRSQSHTSNQVTQGIAGRHFIKQSCNKTRQRQSASDSYTHSREDQLDATFHYQPEYVSRGGAQRLANANLVYALAYHVGYDAVQAHSSQKQSNSSKNSQQGCLKTGETQV